jgi:acetyl-CoA C-acetyltransferase
MIAPDTPVIIGAAQRTVHRGEQPAPEPLELWEQACRAAIADAGLSDVDGLLLTDCMSWRYDDPAGRLAERLGANLRFRHVGPPSGTSGQTLLDQAAREIREGRSELTMVCGGEALATLRQHRMTGTQPEWSHPHPEGPGFAFELDAHQHPGEVAAGLTEGIGAVYGFAMRDIARRAHLGIAPNEYRAQLGETMAGLSRVAARNPHAWFRQERDAGYLSNPGADNRFVSYPYTKHMVAIIDVDMSAAILLASEGWADAHGVPRDRRVYPWISCYAEDPVYIAVRDKLWKSDGMKAASAAVLEAAHLTADDIRHVDLYSCFPAAVNFARDALGISGRNGDEVTLTGGLPYAGGPASSYMLTSIGKIVEVLRGDPGAVGLIGGVGMMMSNHVYALYSTTPPKPQLRYPDARALQARLDAIPQREIDDAYIGSATIAAYTVMHGRDGAAQRGAAICDLPSGARCYANIRNPDILERAEREELVGRSVVIAKGPVIGEIVSVG